MYVGGCRKDGGVVPSSTQSRTFGIWGKRGRGGGKKLSQPFS